MIDHKGPLCWQVSHCVDALHSAVAVTEERTAAYSIPMAASDSATVVKQLGSLTRPGSCYFAPRPHTFASPIYRLAYTPAAAAAFCHTASCGVGHTHGELWAAPPCPFRLSAGVGGSCVGNG
jgi:hypothetical protein